MTRLKTAACIAVAITVLPLGWLCAVFALMGLMGWSGPGWDAFTHFSPLWLIGCLVTCATALLFNGWARRTIAAVAIVGGLAALALILPEFLRDAGPNARKDAPRQIKLIQFNSYYENKRIDAAVDWLFAQHPDFVVVEEPTLEHHQRFLQRTGWTASCAACPVTIYSRWPLATRPLSTPGDTIALSEATFRTPLGDIPVIGVHYPWPISRRQSLQEQRLAETLARYPRTTTLASGDFNSTPWSFQRRRWDRAFVLTRRDRALPSWPAPFAFLPIDHVYAGSAWGTVSIRRGPHLGSDHHPIVVTLALR